MKSMTGYGSCEGKVGKGVLFVEVRSVNGRFLDIACKLPPKMYPIEPRIKKLIGETVLRGKVDVFIKDKREIGEPYELCLNWGLAKQYKKCLTELTKTLGLQTSSHLLEVVDLKDLVSFYEKPIAFNKLWKEIERITLLAVKKFEVMRQKEGLATKKDQLKRLKLLTKLTASIERQSEGRVGEYRERLRQKVMETCKTDESKIECEVAIVAGRTDITEELTRLKSHINQYRLLISKNGSIGRQLDFLLQEMHREINTLGSKANDSSISRFVVDAKAEVEKLREQVQNVE